MQCKAAWRRSSLPAAQASPKMGIESWLESSRRLLHEGMFTLIRHALLSLSGAGIVPSPFEERMQVLCKSTNGFAETHCCICGQGFVMFWDRQSHSERIAALHEIQDTLRRQHRHCPGREAHPKENFPVPEWDTAVACSSVAVSGAVPN